MQATVAGLLSDEQFRIAILQPGALKMDCELKLTKANRLKVARAFQKNKRVDYSIGCVIEGQMGKAFIDDFIHPTAYRITVGPFWYFAEKHAALAVMRW